MDTFQTDHDGAQRTYTLLRSREDFQRFGAATRGAYAGGGPPGYPCLVWLELRPGGGSRYAYLLGHDIRQFNEWFDFRGPSGAPCLDPTLQKMEARLAGLEARFEEVWATHRHEETLRVERMDY